MAFVILLPKQETADNSAEIEHFGGGGVVSVTVSEHVQIVARFY